MDASIHSLSETTASLRAIAATPEYPRHLHVALMAIWSQADEHDRGQLLPDLTRLGFTPRYASPLSHIPLQTDPDLHAAIKAAAYLLKVRPGLSAIPLRKTTVAAVAVILAQPNLTLSTLNDPAGLLDADYWTRVLVAYALCSKGSIPSDFELVPGRPGDLDICQAMYGSATNWPSALRIRLLRTHISEGSDELFKGATCTYNHSDMAALLEELMPQLLGWGTLTERFLALNTSKSPDTAWMAALFGKENLQHFMVRGHRVSLRLEEPGERIPTVLAVSLYRQHYNDVEYLFDDFSDLMSYEPAGGGALHWALRAEHPVPEAVLRRLIAAYGQQLPFPMDSFEEVVLMTYTAYTPAEGLAERIRIDLKQRPGDHAKHREVMSTYLRRLKRNRPHHPWLSKPSAWELCRELGLTGSCPPLLSLPIEVLAYLSRFLAIGDLVSLSKCCATLRTQLQEDSVWRAQLDNLPNHPTLKNYHPWPRNVRLLHPSRDICRVVSLPGIETKTVQDCLGLPAVVRFAPDTFPQRFDSLAAFNDTQKPLAASLALQSLRPLFISSWPIGMLSTIRYAVDHGFELYGRLLDYALDHDGDLALRIFDRGIRPDDYVRLMPLRVLLRSVGRDKDADSLDNLRDTLPIGYQLIFDHLSALGRETSQGVRRTISSKNFLWASGDRVREKLLAVSTLEELTLTAKIWTERGYAYTPELIGSACVCAEDDADQLLQRLTALVAGGAKLDVISPDSGCGLLHVLWRNGLMTSAGSERVLAYLLDQGVILSHANREGKRAITDITHEHPDSRQAVTIVAALLAHGDAFEADRPPAVWLACLGKFVEFEACNPTEKIVHKVITTTLQLGLVNVFDYLMDAHKAAFRTHEANIAITTLVPVHRELILRYVFTREVQLREFFKKQLLLAPQNDLTLEWLTDTWCELACGITETLALNRSDLFDHMVLRVGQSESQERQRLGLLSHAHRQEFDVARTRRYRNNVTLWRQAYQEASPARRSSMRVPLQCRWTKLKFNSQTYDQESMGWSAVTKLDEMLAKIEAMLTTDSCDRPDPCALMNQIVSDDWMSRAWELQTPWRALINGESVQGVLAALYASLPYQQSLSLETWEQICDDLSSLGADFAERDANWGTPLHYLCQKVRDNRASREVILSAVEFAWSNGASEVCGQVQWPGGEPLHMLIQGSNNIELSLEIAEWLITHGHRLNTRNSDGYTPFEHSLRVWQTKPFAQMFYAYGARLSKGIDTRHFDPGLLLAYYDWRAQPKARRK